MVLHPVNRLILKILFKMRDRMVLHPVNRFILKIVFKMRDRMALYPVHRLIFKIVFKMRGKACRVLRTSGIFLCGFAALRAKKIARKGHHTASAPLHDTLPRTGR